MNYWPTQPLGELLVTLESGARPKGGVGEIVGGIPSLGGEHVNRDGGFTWVTPKHVTREFYAGMKRGRIKRGDILVVKDGATTGKTATVRENFPFSEAAVNEHVFLLRTDRAKVLSEFVGYFLFGPVGQQQILSSFHGAAIGGIAQDFVRNVYVPVPPLAEQERIVKLLDEADELRKLRAQADQRATALIPALLQKMFGESATNGKRWRMSALSELITDGPQNGLYKHSSFYGEGIPILRIDAFYDGEVEDLNALKRLRATPEEIKRYGLHEHDIVINRVNSPEYLGKSALIPALPEPIVFESNMMRFSVSTKLVEPGYLIRFLQTPTAKQHVLGRAKHSINQSSINQEDVKCLPVPIPPLPLQKEFAARVTEIRELEAEQANCRHRLDDLFQSMLHRAFSGEL